MRRAIDGPRTGDARLVQRILSWWIAVVLSGVLAHNNRRASGGPVDGAAAFGLDSALGDVR